MRLFSKKVKNAESTEDIEKQKVFQVLTILDKRYQEKRFPIEEKINRIKNEARKSHFEKIAFIAELIDRDFLEITKKHLGKEIGIIEVFNNHASHYVTSSVYYNTQSSNSYYSVFSKERLESILGNLTIGDDNGLSSKNKAEVNRLTKELSDLRQSWIDLYDKIRLWGRVPELLKQVEGF